MCNALWQKALPHFGMYSFEYEWASLTSAFKCNTSFISMEDGLTEDDIEFQQGIRAQLFDNMLQYMPKLFTNHRQDQSELKKDYGTIFSMLDSDLIRHLKTGAGQNAQKPDNVDFYILNYSTVSFK